MRSSKIRQSIWKYRHKINTVLFPCLAKMMYFIPVKKNRIVVCSYHGKGYGDNPASIINSLLKISKEIEIIWLVDPYLVNTWDGPANIKRVRYYTIKSMYYMASASVWIDNCRKDYAPGIKDNQLYIQTWHGGLGFKNVESKLAVDINSFYYKHAIQDAKMSNLMISNSMKTSEIYRDMFWYKGAILENGLPRNDELLDPLECRKAVVRVKNKYLIDKDTHIILYAPTFRDDLNQSAYDLNMDAVVEALSQRFGGKWIGMYRFHPNVDLNKVSGLPHSCINATTYSNSADLLIAADVFITDYSSMLFDFLLGKDKIAFLYASDYKKYISTRGIWLTYDQVPFPYAFDNEELIKKINEFDIDEYKNGVKVLMEKFGLNETGRSSYYTAQLIKNFLECGKLTQSLEEVGTNVGDLRYRS